MKKVLIGFTFLVSMSSFADCRLQINNISPTVEKKEILIVAGNEIFGKFDSIETGPKAASDLMKDIGLSFGKDYALTLDGATLDRENAVKVIEKLAELGLCN